MPLIGDTVRLKAEFKDFDGEYISPDDVKLKIYDGSKQVIEEISVAPYEIGKYQCDYTVVGGYPDPFYYEFTGMLGDKPVLGRSELKRKWV